MSSEAQAVTFSEVPKGRLVVWLVIAGEIAIFGGGIIAYLLYRVRFVDVYNDLASMTSTPLGALNTLVLLTSSWCIVMAHHYAGKKNLSKMKSFLWFTILLGSMFLVIKGFEWGGKIGAEHGGIVLGAFSTELSELMGPGQTFWWFYYFLTGMHAVHVILGMLIIFIVMVNVKKGSNLHRVEMAGIYWHFVDLVWIFLFPLFYLSR